MSNSNNNSRPNTSDFRARNDDSLKSTTMIANFYEFIFPDVVPKLYQYKVSTLPKIDKDKFRKLRYQLIFSQNNNTSEIAQQNPQNPQQIQDDSEMKDQTISEGGSTHTQSENDSQDENQKQTTETLTVKDIFGKSCRFLPSEDYPANALYSLKRVGESVQLTRKLQDGREYQVTMNFEKEIAPSDMALKDFLQDYVYHEIILKSFPQYRKLGRKYIYSNERSIHLKEHDIEIWQGFRYEVRNEIQGQTQLMDGGQVSSVLHMLNIDVDYLIVRMESALDLIKEVHKALIDQEPNEAEHSGSLLVNMFHKEVKRLLVGKVVVTKYNNMPYRIKDVDFKQNPECTFVLNENKKKIKKTYSDYLEERYYKTVTDKEQPLLITHNGLALVPEFCMLTGLSEETWNSSSKFNLIRDVINSTKPDVQRRIVDIKKDFFDKLQIDNDIKINSMPYVLEGFKLESPIMQMAKLPQGPRVEVSTARIEDLEKKVYSQQPLKMFEAPPLETWCLFCLENEEHIATRFLHTFQESLTTYNYHAKEIKIVKVKSINKTDWAETLKANLSTHVIACLLIIPGTKGIVNSLYTHIKRQLLTDIPVPSQVVLSSTIEKSKSALYTICNKVLLQLCAKIGGEPWALNELPFFYSCTMVIGYHVFDQLIGYTSSMNNKASRYWSKSLPLFEEKEDNASFRHQQRTPRLLSKLQSLFFESLLAFKLRINTYPTQLFIFTNLRQQDNLVLEIDAIQSMLTKMQLQAKFTFVQVDASTQRHVQFGQIESQRHISPASFGMVVPISKMGGDNGGQKSIEFYMTSYYNRDLNQTGAIHYSVLKDDLIQCNQQSALQDPTSTFESLFSLIHRLSLMYYGGGSHFGAHVCGIPAPLKYAHKMGQQALQLGIRDREVVTAHEHFDKSIFGLYYL